MLFFVLIGILAMGGLGFWILITPSNLLIRSFRTAFSSPEARVITGPYPTEEDLATLKLHGVTTVVSLLDPQLPYEGVLLAREQDTVKARGMAFHNFPMASIFGHRLGNQYDQNADAAAAVIAKASGKVYVHCYLGIHRVRVVEQRLTVLTHIAIQHYLLREGERGRAQRLLDQAQAAFDQGRYQEVLDWVGRLSSPDVPANVLAGWAAYRMGNLAAARERFQQVLDVVPGSGEALRGLGYCSFREKDYKAAETHFVAVLKDDPTDGSALYGLACVRRGQDRPAESAELLHRLLVAQPDHREAQELVREVEGNFSPTP